MVASLLLTFCNVHTAAVKTTPSRYMAAPGKLLLVLRREVAKEEMASKTCITNEFKNS